MRCRYCHQEIVREGNEYRLLAADSIGNFFLCHVRDDDDPDLGVMGNHYPYSEVQEIQQLLKEYEK